jgi:hypothetical protein
MKWHLTALVLEECLASIAISHFARRERTIHVAFALLALGLTTGAIYLTYERRVTDPILDP